MSEPISPIGPTRVCLLPSPIRCAVTILGLSILVALAGQQADAQVITYKIHPDIFTELQNRYPMQAADYWEDIKKMIRDAIGKWTALNPSLIFTPSHTNDEYDVVVEWIDADFVWGVEYHDTGGTVNRIGIDFDTPEPDEYGASLTNPDIIRYVMAHELGHVLGLGHSSELGHLMYGTSNPKPDRAFNSRGYQVPTIHIENFENVESSMEISFHLKGHNVFDIDVLDINGTQYVAAATGKNGLHILDMSYPSRPKLAGSFNSSAGVIEAVGDSALIALFHEDNFEVLNVSDPNHIILTSVTNHLGGNPILDAIVIEVDGKPFVITVSKGIIQQYDVSNPYDIRRSGVYSDDFGLLGVNAVDGMIHEDKTYALVDATYDGTLVFMISRDRGPVLITQHMSEFEYDDTIQAITDIGNTKYQVLYWNGQIKLHEIVPDGDDILIGRLLGYDVHEIDILRAGGNVYAVVAAGAEGILGIHIGDETTGGWTLG